MAYVQSDVTWGEQVPFGDRYRRILTFTEADAGANSEWSVSGLPVDFDLVSFTQTLIVATSTGTTIGPLELGNAAGFTVAAGGVATDQNHIATSSEAAAKTVRDQTRLHCPVGDGGTLYGRSKVDAGADNDIMTELVIEYGGE